MKRIYVALGFSLLLIGLLITTATADVLFMTNQFEFVLPNSWGYDEAGLIYARCRCSNGDAFQFYESNIEVPKTTEEIVDRTAKFFGAHEYVSGFEEIEIAGKKTVLIAIHPKDTTGYMTMFEKDGRTIAAFCLTRSQNDLKTLFVNGLNSVRSRSEKDFEFFNYGNAMAKFKDYTVKTIGSKKYLILNFVWRNIGQTATMFAVNVDVKVYQDGIQLNKGFILTESTEEATSIMPGKEFTVKQIFEMRSSTGEIKVVVDKIMDYTHEFIDRNYTLNLK